MCPLPAYKVRDGQSHGKGSALKGDPELGISFTSCRYDFMVCVCPFGGDTGVVHLVTLGWWHWGGDLRPPWAADPLMLWHLPQHLGFLCSRLTQCPAASPGDNHPARWFQGKEPALVAERCFGRRHSQGQALPQLPLVQAHCRAVDTLDKGIRGCLVLPPQVPTRTASKAWQTTEDALLGLSETNNAITLCRLLQVANKRWQTKHTTDPPPGQQSNQEEADNGRAPPALCQGHSPPTTSTRCCLAEPLATRHPFCLARMEPILACGPPCLCQSCIYHRLPCQEFSTSPCCNLNSPLSAPACAAPPFPPPSRGAGCDTRVNVSYPEMSQQVPCPEVTAWFPEMLTISRSVQHLKNKWKHNSEPQRLMSI